ncbi:hypothetical protein SAMN02910429_00261 [Lachnobacterium bovis]|uniref:Uncharacterized protein n=2 Tax=Lachnobacterium bovis TaxID=140626 RepID=A0A1H9PGM7_9FIRM|nr:hypothetical protein SAMN02910429_00261 [Lachnobacterium bovis]
MLSFFKEAVDMDSVTNTMLRFMHSYEAYRVPKGTKVKNSRGEETVLSEDEDVLVLTEKATNQMRKDKDEYAKQLEINANMAQEKTNLEANKKDAQDKAKIMAVFRSMANGDMVPASDERKLMEFDDKMYQAAKALQFLSRQNKERIKKKASEWDEDEELAHEEKMRELEKNQREARDTIGPNLNEFSDKQRRNIVEIPSDNIDFANMRTVQFESSFEGILMDFSI